MHVPRLNLTRLVPEPLGRDNQMEHPYTHPPHPHPSSPSPLPSHSRLNTTLASRLRFCSLSTSPGLNTAFTLRMLLSTIPASYLNGNNVIPRSSMRGCSVDGAHAAAASAGLCFLGPAGLVQSCRCRVLFASSSSEEESSSASRRRHTRYRRWFRFLRRLHFRCIAPIRMW